MRKMKSRIAKILKSETWELAEREEVKCVKQEYSLLAVKETTDHQ